MDEPSSDFGDDLFGPLPPGRTHDYSGARGVHYVYYLYAGLPEDPNDWACVYIGVTSNLPRRLAEHAKKWWWRAVDPDLSYFEPYRTRAEAEAAERAAIWQIQPAMNRAGRLLVVG